MRASTGSDPSPLRTLIVDDEYPARAELRFCLEQQPGVEVLGEAATAKEGLSLIDGLHYEVVFLDIAMPGLSGLELASRLKERPNPPAVVFVTAYDTFAVKAYEMRGIDYLLKPVSPERVAEALARVRGALGRAHGTAQAAATGGETPSSGGRPFVMAVQDEAAVPVPQEEIVFAATEGDHVYLYTEKDRYLTRHTLAELEELLPARSFLRCHRSYLLNLDRVLEIRPFFNGAYTLVVPHGGKKVSVPVSRNRAGEMKRFFWPKERA